MGRMLDALNRTPATPEPAPAPLPHPPAVPADLPVVDAVECPAEGSDLEVEPAIPFIEVGGPRSAMEASPEVLAAPAPPVRGVKPTSGASADPEVVSIWCSWTIRMGATVGK